MEAPLSRERLRTDSLLLRLLSSLLKWTWFGYSTADLNFHVVDSNCHYCRMVDYPTTIPLDRITYWTTTVQDGREHSTETWTATVEL